MITTETKLAVTEGEDCVYRYTFERSKEGEVRIVYETRKDVDSPWVASSGVWLSNKVLDELFEVVRRVSQGA